MKKLRYPSYVPFTLLQASIVLFGVTVLMVLQQFINHVSNGYIFTFSWEFVILRTTITNGLFLLMIPLFCRILKNHLKKQLPKFSKWLTLAVSVFLVAIVHQVLTLLLFDLIYSFFNNAEFDFFRAQNIASLSPGVLSSVLQIIVIIAIIWGKGYYDRFIKQKEALELAELKALKMQLQPHFLFNTLNSITALIDIDSKKAQKMLTQLGYLMRNILEHNNQHLIPLEDELMYIKTYLDIEHVRYMDRLQLKFDIDTKLKSVKVPSLILQPLVENAIKHGISKSPTGGTIELYAFLNVAHSKPMLELKVVNDLGQDPPMQSMNGYGIGTMNVKDRLKLHYGDNYSFILHTDEVKHTSKIIIPLQI